MNIRWLENFKQTALIAWWITSIRTDCCSHWYMFLQWVGDSCKIYMQGPKNPLKTPAGVIVIRADERLDSASEAISRYNTCLYWLSPVLPDLSCVPSQWEIIESMYIMVIYLIFRLATRTGRIQMMNKPPCGKQLCSMQCQTFLTMWKEFWSCRRKVVHEYNIEINAMPGWVSGWIW